jgi:alpha-beta hydrolase superfamily lysophospholipase
MGHYTATLTAADGTKLFTQRWTPPEGSKGTIVIAHGYAEHSGRYQHVAEYFVQQGYAVYALDHRGHGHSQGETLGYFERFENLSDDLRRVIEWARAEERVGPLFLLGHSMGGLLSLYTVIHAQAMLKGLVLSGPLFPTSNTVALPMRILARTLGMIAPHAGTLALDSNTISKDPEVVQAYDSDPNVYHGKIPARVGAEWIAAADYIKANFSRITLPILILHGSADRLVLPTSSQVIHDGVSSPDKTLKIYDGLYHEILNEPEKQRVLADIWVWLASHHGTSELRAAAPIKQQ